MKDRQDRLYTGSSSQPMNSMGFQGVFRPSPSVY